MIELQHEKEYEKTLTWIKSFDKIYKKVLSITDKKPYIEKLEPYGKIKT